MISSEQKNLGPILEVSGLNLSCTFMSGISGNVNTADSGIWKMPHRNYAAGVLGRFISRDPIGHRGGLNLYAYPTNPVNYVDPEGLDLVLSGTAAAQAYVVSQLEAATGYSLKNTNGRITIDSASGINFSGTCGDSRQLLGQIIGNTNVTTKAWATTTSELLNVGALTPVQVSQTNTGLFAGLTPQGVQGLITDNIRQITAQDASLGQGTLLHEIAEAYKYAKSQQGYSGCHQDGISAENDFYENVAPNLRRTGKGGKLTDQSGNVYGVYLDYTGAKLQIIDGAPGQAPTFQVIKR